MNTKNVVYAVIDSRKDGRGDEFSQEFGADVEAAVRAAGYDWDHLTETEKEARTIAVCVSDPDEDGRFDFGAYDIYRAWA